MATFRERELVSASCLEARMTSASGVMDGMTTANGLPPVDRKSAYALDDWKGPAVSRPLLSHTLERSRHSPRGELRSTALRAWVRSSGRR
jgi:hypothetical protein